MRNQNPPIPGQLVDLQPLRTAMHGSDSKTIKAGEGFEFYSKSQEVRTQTISEVRLPGLPFFIRFGSCEAHTRQVDKTSDVPSPLHEVCYQCKDSHVQHWIACINEEDCEIGQDAYEAFSVASQSSLEISDASGHTDPLESEDDTTQGMVVRQGEQLHPREHEKLIFTDVSIYLFIWCFMSLSTARVILRRVVYRWKKPVHNAL